MLSLRFRYLAATLVINWLSSHEDPTLQRMAVAVISVLVAKVKTLLTHCVFVCCRNVAWHLSVPPVESSSGQAAPVPLRHHSQQPTLYFNSGLLNGANFPCGRKVRSCLTFRKLEDALRLNKSL